MKYYYSFFESPVGKITMISDGKYLRKLYIGNGECVEGVRDSKNILLREVKKQLEEYFDSKRKVFSVPLFFEGTEFQKSVWKELCEIPYGKVVSYKDIAKNIRNSKAVRAVGSANGKNNIAIIVPCHRVISSDGSIGGYAGGVDIKRALLKLEGVDLF